MNNLLCTTKLIISTLALEITGAHVSDKSHCAFSLSSYFKIILFLASLIRYQQPLGGALILN